MLILKAVVAHMHCFSLPMKGKAKYEAKYEAHHEIETMIEGVFGPPFWIQSGALQFSVLKLRKSESGLKPGSELTLIPDAPWCWTIDLYKI